jgi:hypothetical protein
MNQRHKWAKPDRFQFKTERQCMRCELVRVTRHDNPHGQPWIEYWRDLERVHHASTPPCDARLEQTSEVAL